MQAAPLFAGDDLHSAGLSGSSFCATCGAVPFGQRICVIVEPQGPQTAAGVWGAVETVLLKMFRLVPRSWTWGVIALLNRHLTAAFRSVVPRLAEAALLKACFCSSIRFFQGISKTPRRAS